MREVEGSDVATEDKAAWNAAVAAFKRPHGITRPTCSSVGGAKVEAVPVLGASEFGLDGSGAMLT